MHIEIYMYMFVGLWITFFLDAFGINELTMYEGEWNEEVYCVSGDILDGVSRNSFQNTAI